MTFTVRRAATPTAVVPLRWRRLWIGVGFAGLVLLVVLSLMPQPPEIPGDREGWAGHVLAYGTLTGWFARLAPDRGVRSRIAVALCALGVLLECLQGLSDWRTFDPLDMLANAAGVLAGWLASPPRLPNGLPRLERVLLPRPGSQ